MIKKYNNIDKNITGKLLNGARESKNITKIELSKKLELLGIYLNRDEIRLIENGNLMVKDFELVALCIVLDINMNEFKNLID